MAFYISYVILPRKPQTSVPTVPILGKVCISQEWVTITNVYIVIGAEWKVVNEIKVNISESWDPLI